jgi:hypothetical protein
MPVLALAQEQGRVLAPPAPPRLVVVVGQVVVDRSLQLHGHRAV